MCSSFAIHMPLTVNSLIYYQSIFLYKIIWFCDLHRGSEIILERIKSIGILFADTYTIRRSIEDANSKIITSGTHIFCLPTIQLCSYTWPETLRPRCNFHGI